ncbi:unnamed protein product [Caenorhabditis brenneri]
MFRAIIDAFNFTSGAEEPTEDVPNTKEDIDEDGWVNFGVPSVDSEEDEEEFAIVENPEIMEMGDNDTVIAPMVTRKISPELEAVKRREEYNQARAKTAFRNHLESVMFSDPISGKDVRTCEKVSTGASRSTGSSHGTNSIRRLNTQSQRSKKSSGKSNDRKTHRVSDLQVVDACKF